MTLWGTTASSGDYRIRLHPGQWQAWQSRKRFVVVLAGTQSGKTSFGPLWLGREIDRCGAGDYLAVTATYDLFKLKMLPQMRATFEQASGRGKYWSGDRILELGRLDRTTDPPTLHFAARADDPMWGRIILRSADSPGGLESATANAAWLDEAGMDNFTLEAFEAVLRRLALGQGRCLMTTTLYNLGWLKRRLYDPWLAAGGKHPEIDVVQFDSTENPSFPAAEYERARASMPAWRFDMFYRGRFARPAGLIYDCFDDLRHIVPRFTLPEAWPRFVGLDFGGIHTAAVFLAGELNRQGEETGRLFAYREYLPRKMLAAARHADALLAGERELPLCCGGSASEGQWREEFAAGGLPILAPPIKDVEVGINRVYGTMARGELLVFDDLEGLLDELHTYSREVDAFGEPTEKIADKAGFHRLDALRYILAYLKRGGQDLPIEADDRGGVLAHFPRSALESLLAEADLDDEGRPRAAEASDRNLLGERRPW